MSELHDLTALAEALLVYASAPRRVALTKAMAVALRRSQAQRITEQKNPDGSSYVPRKRQELRGKKGRIKRRGAKLGPMFRKLGAVSAMTADATPFSAEVAFKGAGANRIARVHQLGLRDRVSRNPNAPEVRYPMRVLLGFTGADTDMVEAALLEMLQHR